MLRDNLFENMPTDTFDRDLKPTEITKEAIEEARDLIGVELSTDDRGIRRRHNWNIEATEDTIRHFARAYGDDNPLYTDPEYAQDTKWGGLIAPPTWLYTVDTTSVSIKLQGLQWIYAGTRFEFERPVKQGDRFSTSVKLTDVEKKKGATGGDMILQRGEVKFKSQDDLVATAKTRVMRIPRKRPDSDDDTSIHQEREEKYWTEDELKEIEDQILEQSRRGSEPRYWENVTVGDKLEPRLKGPLTVTDELCWYMGRGLPIYFPHELFIKERMRHPDEAYRRRDNGLLEHPATGHVDEEVATGIGAPKAYDFGPQRISWLAQTVTDWMGDDAFMTTLDCRLERLNYIGDMTRCEGEVVDKYVDSETNDHLVDIELRGVNHLDETHTTGDCTVKLPTDD